MADGTPPQSAPRSAPSDPQLVALALAGEAAAFEAIVHRHYGPVYAVALAVLGNTADAEDICHDALVHGLARLHECRNPERLGQWLGAIVRNRSRNHLVSPAVRRSAPLDPETRDSRATPARRTELQDLRGTLEQALAQLTPIQREVVLLHDLHDWPHENIAESIGTTPGMSRQHLFKARRRLRETLGPHLLHEYFND